MPKSVNRAGGVRCSDLEGHRGSVSALHVDAATNRAVSARYDKTLRVWDLMFAEGQVRLLGPAHGWAGGAGDAATRGGPPATPRGDVISSY